MSRGGVINPRTKAEGGDNIGGGQGGGKQRGEGTDEGGVKSRKYYVMRFHGKGTRSLQTGNLREGGLRTRKAF